MTKYTTERLNGSSHHSILRLIDARCNIYGLPPMVHFQFVAGHYFSSSLLHAATAVHDIHGDHAKNDTIDRLR